MKRFQESTAGRLLALAVALPLAAGALAVWGPVGAGMVAIIGSIFVGILLGMVGVGLALEDHGEYALVAILVLPPALLLYTPAVGLASDMPVIRLVMALGAVATLFMALRGTLSRARVAMSATSARHAV